MRMKGIRSLRELTRILDVDRRLRRLCLIQRDERGYPRSVISRFTRRVGAETLQLIIEEKVIWLLRRSGATEVDALLDASFIKARSIRHPDNGRIAYSDVDALVGRNGRGYDLGYKFHVAVDHRTMLPLATILAPANDNEKRHAPSLVERTRIVLSKAGAQLRSLVADSQYSSRKMRDLVPDSVIPYMSNQAESGVLRVDRRFRTHGPTGLVEEYHKRPLVESLFSFLKDQYGLRVNNVRRLAYVSVYALLSLLCHVLVREAAEGLGRPEKAVSPTFFN
ncbi:transposase, partial [Candidatus Bathyarchaeota archaeon]|nr:transposase [Candidatus Bathyarchaeota archaeon]